MQASLGFVFRIVHSAFRYENRQDLLDDIDLGWE